jgi:hypothetical protein
LAARSGSQLGPGSFYLATTTLEKLDFDPKLTILIERHRQQAEAFRYEA